MMAKGAREAAAASQAAKPAVLRSHKKKAIRVRHRGDANERAAGGEGVQKKCMDGAKHKGGAIKSAEMRVKEKRELGRSGSTSEAPGLQYRGRRLTRN